ncbi:Protein RTM1, partial [Fusarium oxysporum f. sp. albedinis]
RQFSDNPLTKTLLVSFLKPTKRFCAKRAGTTTLPATAVDSQSADAVARLTISQTAVLHQNSASTA